MGRMTVPKRWGVLPDMYAPRTPEDKRYMMADIKHAVNSVAEGRTRHSCNALPHLLVEPYSEAMYANPDAGFHTYLWEHCKKNSPLSVPDIEQYYRESPLLVRYRVAALKTFLHIVRRTIPLSKRDKQKRGT
jgi:hypothetical protein